MDKHTRAILFGRHGAVWESTLREWEECARANHAAERKARRFLWLMMLYLAAEFVIALVLCLRG